MANVLKRLLIVSFFLTVAALWLIDQVPIAEDADIANAVGKIIAIDYGKFEERSKVNDSYQGKIYYVQPRSHGRPVVIIYEVTEPDEIESIEASARRALSNVKNVKSITLKFIEKQNMVIKPNHSGHRENENVIKEIKFEK